MLHDVTRQTIEDFRDERLRDLRESPATVCRRLATIKHFCGMVGRLYKDYFDPSKEVRAPRIGQYKPRCLPEREIPAVRTAANNIGKVPKLWARNNAIVQVALNSGLRCNELIELTAGQLRSNLSALVLVRGKGNTFLTKPLNSEAQSALQSYLVLRENMLLKEDPRYASLNGVAQGLYPLFCSSTGAVSGVPHTWKLNPKTVWRIFKILGDLAGVERMHPHRARHTFVDQYYKATGDIMLTRDAAGHSQVTTTMRYLAPSEEAVMEGYEDLYKNFRA